MRERLLLVLLAATILLSVWLHLQTRHPVTPPSRREAPARPAPQPSAVNAAEGRDVRRNLFEYADAKPVVRKSTPLPAVAPTQTPVPSVKLVGILHSAPGRRAALSSQGQIVVAAPGETVDGYEVLSIDDEDGVRLRSPEGTEIVLAPPR